LQLRRKARCFKEQFMADDPRKNPNEQSGSGQSQKSGQDYDQRNKGQQGLLMAKTKRRMTSNRAASVEPRNSYHHGEEESGPSQAGSSRFF
jgi:hypothetical protein